MLARPFFVANWKMNMLTREAAKYILEFRRLYRISPSGLDDAVLAPPFTLLAGLREQLGGLPGVLLGAQNIHWEDSGAQTGEISAPMLREFGVSFAIVGHSERRQSFGENDEHVALRAAQALKHGIRPVICVGETLEQHDAGKMEEVIAKMVDGAYKYIPEEQAKLPIVAYEPVWAVGTGRAAKPKTIEAAHSFIRGRLLDKYKGLDQSNVRIIYGGSTSPENIEEIMRVPGVGGALVGGASLSAEKFWAMISKGRAVAGSTA